MRFKVDGYLYDAESLPEFDPKDRHDVDIVVDRLKVRADARQRLAESLETALRLADGRVIVENLDKGCSQPFSSHYCCPECGYSIEEMEPRIFSFNNPMGACPACNGMGKRYVFTAKSVVRHPELSLSTGAIHGWDRRNLYNFEVIEAVAKHCGFDVNTPWNGLREEDRRAVLYGLDDELIELPYRRAGKTILRQEPWEALCSFIISQCNNISRIKGIVERLCSNFGQPVEFEGRTFYSFPSAAELAALPEAALDVLRCGYRAPYISAAAMAVAGGALDLDSLIRCDSSTAKRSLMALPGIGEKVANCVVLFGLYHMEAFPIDVWIRRALREHFPQDFDPACLGDYAGLAQQYIFYYARSTGDGK